MNKYKVLIALSILIISFFVFRYFYLGNPRLILTNVDNSTIDSVYVQVTGNNYFIQKIEPGKAKTIRVNPLSDSDIVVFTQNREYEIVIGIYLDRASAGGYIKAKITGDSLVSFEHKRGVL